MIIIFNSHFSGDIPTTIIKRNEDFDSGGKLKTLYIILLVFIPLLCIQNIDLDTILMFLTGQTEIKQHREKHDLNKLNGKIKKLQCNL